MRSKIEEHSYILSYFQGTSIPYGYAIF